jgi:hypothetical protein
MSFRIILTAVIGAALAAPLGAQGLLPGIGLPDPVGGVLDPVLGTVERAASEATREVRQLAQDRVHAIDRLVRRNPEAIERDALGQPARRGEVLVIDAPEAELALARAAGFAVLGSETIEPLGLTVVRLSLPAGMPLARAEDAVARLLPSATVAPDSLHFQAGSAAQLSVAATAQAGQRAAPVGMIDGAPGSNASVIAVRGFAEGAPTPSNHGSAVASLLASAGAGRIRVADVYGTDKAGGNALAIVRGLGWLTGEGSKVVTISLVGPKNPVLARAIEAARKQGVVIVAAVGNDGPASPPAYPASYDGVVAVTAVDGRRRALIEAGKALHLDYAAPGADLYGRNAAGKRVKLRGTSFATPLVAARAALAIGSGRNWRTALDGEAIDLGAKGPDDIYGRGLVCAQCRGE